MHEFVDDLRDLNVTPHIAQNTTNRTSAIDARTTRHPGYAISQQKRKRTEEPFGWARPSAGSPGRCCAASHAYGSSSPDNGSLRPHPAAQIARGVGMTGGTWTEMKSRSRNAITGRGPTVTADRRTSAQISAACTCV